ncbi:MFS transporter [Alkalihalobacillus sp. LMS39]|uniref:MFS transporter n=1 Tax=Alkalihalobacillus sp. LMS39 TaxID=2924032 RepID=UPI001FB25086|nr:MFS transporter [Alkalihalobacillus sp. LMS39]UOE93030.1 MFS transporter [Alkalihalobacillus sp. LMS39]
MKLIYIIIIVAFLDTFSQLPIISPYAMSLGATPLLTGVIIGMYSFSNIIGNLLAGILIDKRGAKPILFIGMLFVSVMMFFYTVTANAEQLIIVRFFHGLAGGLIVPAAFTILSAKKAETRKGKAMAFSGAAVGIAAIIGPPIGAIISSSYGYNSLFYFLSGLMLIFALCALFFLHPSQKQSPLQSENKTPHGFRLSKALLYSYLSIFLLLCTLGILTYALPLQVSQLQLHSALTGPLLSTFGIIAILIFLLPTNKIFDIENKETITSIGLCFISIALLILSLSTNALSLFTAMVVYGIGFAFIFPTTSAIVLERSGNEKRGMAFGIYYACFSFGVICGSFLSGSLPLSPSALFLFGTIITLLTLGFFKLGICIKDSINF